MKLAKKLLELYILIWRVESVSQDFKDASLRHLFKNKGKRHVCDNWRGISLALQVKFLLELFSTELSSILFTTSIQNLNVASVLVVALLT